MKDRECQIENSPGATVREETLGDFHCHLCLFLRRAWLGGHRNIRQAPPIPREVVTTDGQVLVSGDDIQDGQNVWQAMGGMEMGSIWGHGSYVAPDWTADYLHRESLFILDTWSQKDFAATYDKASSEQQAILRQRLQDLVRRNNYDAASDRLTIEPIRAEAGPGTGVNVCSKNLELGTDLRDSGPPLCRNCLDLKISSFG